LQSVGAFPDSIELLLRPRAHRLRRMEHERHQRLRGALERQHGHVDTPRAQRRHDDGAPLHHGSPRRAIRRRAVCCRPLARDVHHVEQHLERLLPRVVIVPHVTQRRSKRCHHVPVDRLRASTQR
jgi:hypothetical protein